MSASILMGVTLYLILSVLLVDLLHLFVKLKPKFYGIAAISLAVLISGYGIFNSYNLRAEEITVQIKGITKEVKAMQLSDIHIGHFRGRGLIQKIVEQIKKHNVDVVFITGDLFDGKIGLNMDVISPLTELDIPIYFIEGNHEGYTDSEKIKDELRRTGIRVLEDEVSTWGEFQIIGLNHMLADNKSVDMHTRGNNSTIKDILPTLNIKKDKPSILLHHSPDGIKYANEQGVDLFLAGHTHAGQMYPVNYIAALIFPYNKGLHHYNGTQLYVSEGAGTFGPPLRVGTISEITVINLKPQK
ncbi:metallophosphoesterase [Acidobacteriota bacterium]